MQAIKSRHQPVVWNSAKNCAHLLGDSSNAEAIIPMLMVCLLVTSDLTACADSELSLMAFTIKRLDNL